MTVVIKDVRDFFRDRPEDNVTYLKEFFDQRDMDLAMKMATDAYKYLPPMLRNTDQAAPDYVMLFGIAAFLLLIRINNLTINYTPGVNEGNIQLSVGDEIGLLKDLHGTYFTLFQDMVYKHKKMLDVRKALGTVGTPYGSRRR